MLWDKGTWHSLDKNAHQAYEKGHLRLVLCAEKLAGRWDLIRFKDDKHWFLIKYQDEYAQSQSSCDVTDLDKSVLSGSPWNTLVQTMKTSGPMKV